MLAAEPLVCAELFGTANAGFDSAGDAAGEERVAAEYERVYDIPERRAEIEWLKEKLPRLLSGHDVLEIACGTGYWTQPISLQANSILATDVNDEVLEIARAKAYGRGNVRFLRADAADLSRLEGSFTAAFAGFFWSHVRKSALRPFLLGLHAKIGPGRLVVFLDNTLAGTRHPITRIDAEGNTYQTRKLEDGSEWEVLKNIPGEADLRATLQGIAGDIEVATLQYYWLLTYRTPSSP